MDKVLFTKDNIDNLLFQLAKEYKKLNRKNTQAEIIIIGGAAIVSKYGFRASTTDIDSLIFASSSMKDAINIVGDRNGLSNGWINEEFRKTSSYTEKIRQYSKHYKMFANILEARMLPPEYDVAMKLASLRPYKNDMSDAVGIIKSEKITREQIEKALVDFYGGFKNLSHPEDARKFLDSIFSSDNLEELYGSTRISESDNHIILKDIDDNYPKLLNEGNLASVLAAAKKKRDSKSK
ncbi:hypothetical protein SAMN02910275_01739 [Butyrivibrio sp. INlla18]|uniref:DUF6036 family nucleotidyltransferase n=1 Tax=Butyrivibrio sp. INlla18 TaxID=1520806 RepID=UPI0008825A40|nr:DUF6036 family nucleotidyltransferase [Butyrivibrio sp. INlla18]SDA63002.1 hypothetical protein SAMN02910275_01739 [Butyrivibrio sp. INlla18]